MAQQIELTNVALDCLLYLDEKAQHHYAHTRPTPDVSSALVVFIHWIFDYNRKLGLWQIVYDT